MTIQNIQLTYENAAAEFTRKIASTEEPYSRLLEKKLEKKDNSSTEEAIPVGRTAYTTEEWDAMLANFDATLEDLREQMRAEHKKRYEELLEKKARIEAEIERANISADINGPNPFAVENDFTEFSTSRYDVIADNEFDCYEIYNKSGERVGKFAYSDIEIKVDSATGTRLLISDHGTAAYDALLLDKELIAGFEQSMGVEQLEQTTLTGYTLKKHMEQEFLNN